MFVGGTFVGQALNPNQFEQQQAARLAEINAAPDSQRAAATTTDGHPADGEARPRGAERSQ